MAPVVLPACGSTSTNGSGGGNSPSALPQVDDNGGGILTAPEIVTVTFAPSLYVNAKSPAAATMLADLQDFDDTITQSEWWDTVRAGYCEPLNSTNCVQRGTTLAPSIGHVSIATAPDATYTDAAAGSSASTLQTYITSLFTAGTLPAPNANSLYVFYFPQSTVISFDGAATCSQIGGYHNSLPVGSLDVPYAIISICDPEQTAQATPELTVEQTATFSASHEIIEATTDPHAGKASATSNSTQNLGFYMTDDASQAWPLVLGGGEVADLCVDIFGFGEDRTTEGAYTVQRVWNNLSAAAGHDPCVPIPSGEVYFNVAPPVSADQLQESVGATQTFDATPFADGTMAPWQVELLDVGQGASGAQSTVLTTSPSKGTATVGSPVACSIKLNSSPPVQSNEQAGSPGYEPYVILSLNAAGVYHLWPGIVTLPL